MKKAILAVSIACATVIAVGQSNARQDSSAQATGVVSPRDAATGQASGKRMHKPMMVNESMSARETGTGMATGKTMASDNGQAQPNNKNNMSGAQSNPLYQPSGNSGVNPLFQGSARATMPRSNVQNNVADVNGDGAADRTIVKSKSNITNNRVSAGDVNGDGTADVTASPNSAPAQMKGDLSRGHQPDRKAPGAANNNASREAQSGLATGKRQHD